MERNDGGSQATSLPGHLRAAVEELEHIEHPLVAVVSRRPKAPAARRLAKALPAADVRVVHLDGGNLEQGHVLLTASGPFDAVIDRSDDGLARRFARYLFHTKAGGLYVISTSDDEAGTGVGWLDDLERRRDGGTTPPRVGDRRDPGDRDADALAWSIESVRRGDGFVVVRNRARTVATIRERQTNRVLALSGAEADVLASRPGASVTLGPGTTVLPHEGTTPSLPSEMQAPELHLRRWADAECHPGQVAIHRGMLLPASLAGHNQGRLGHPRLARWAPGFVSRPADDVESLPGAWFYLDNWRRGHFGHALTEQLSVTWGWDDARARHPQLGALVFASPDSPVADWEYALLEAAGVPRDRVYAATRPVRVETLLTATPMFSRPDYIHPEIAAVYDRVGRALAAQAPDRPRPDRVFLTRSSGKRACRNATRVEDLHRRHGFEIVEPASLPLGEQVRLVREASVVSGFAGSGMFHIALAGGPKQVIAIGHEAYPAHNEQMFAAVLGHRLDLVRAKPDVPRGERFELRSFHSSFAIDFEREGAFLERLLDDLG